MHYSQLLEFHSFFRWVVLLAGIFSWIVAISGWGGTKPASGLLRGSGAIFVATIDLQFIVGLILYFAVSPLTKAAFQNMAVAMKDHEMRFFTVEHTTYMVLAVALAHVGGVMSRKGATDRAKYRRAAIWYGLSLVLILAGIPWWRPLFRLGG